MKKITIAGGGVLGSQIALLNAYHGMDTTVWLRSPASIGRAKPKFEKAIQEILADIDLAKKHPGFIPSGLVIDGQFDPEIARKKILEAKDKIHFELDLAKAVDGADLVIETVSEAAPDKIEFYKKMAPLLDDKTIVVTNSSTLLPSMFAEASGRPDRYLSLHFANHIWKNNLTEVMVQPRTDPESFEAVIDYAKSIGMDPVAVRKEKSGYLLNSMLVPFLFSAMDLLVTGVSDVDDIDKAWIKGSGAPYGPFRILDSVGLETARNIALMYSQIPDDIAPFHYKDIAKMLGEKIEKGEKFYS